jgi:hypothetical protein
MGKVTRHTSLSLARVRLLLMMSVSMAAGARTMTDHLSLTKISKFFIAIIVGFSDPDILIYLTLPITTRGQVVTRRCRHMRHPGSTIAHIQGLHFAPGYAIKGIQGRLPPNKLWATEGGALVTAPATVMRHNWTSRVWVV